jgi:hypothetical protein
MEKSDASVEITAAQAQQIGALLDSHRQFIETHELAKRVHTLEQLQQK